MSISALSTSLSNDTLYALLGTSAKKTTTDPTAADASTTASDSTSAATKDLTALLKALASGDLTAAKTDLAKLKGDLKTSESSSSASSTDSSTSAGGTSGLDKLVAKLSDALNGGSTENALNDVARYLVSTGLTSGVLLNTTA